MQIKGDIGSTLPIYIWILYFGFKEHTNILYIIYNGARRFLLTKAAQTPLSDHFEIY